MSNKENTDILCHRCRWGAAPGKLTRCSCPEAVGTFNALCKRKGLTHVDDTATAAAWALPSVAAASGCCRLYSPPE